MPFTRLDYPANRAVAFQPKTLGSSLKGDAYTIAGYWHERKKDRRIAAYGVIYIQGDPYGLGADNSELYQELLRTASNDAYFGSVSYGAAYKLGHSKPYSDSYYRQEIEESNFDRRVLELMLEQEFFVPPGTDAWWRLPAPYRTR